MTLELTTTNKESLNRVLATMPAKADHIRPILEAVRDHGLIYATILQGGELDELPERARGRAVVSIIGDDLDEAMGPAGFPTLTLLNAFKEARSVFLMSGMQPVAYSIAVADALMFQHQVVIIETRSEQEAAWLAHVKQHAPNAHLMVVTPNPLKYGHQGGSA